MFDSGQIWAFPTNTSFGLGVRADDKASLQRMFDLKGREKGKYFSLMLKNMDMLREFAEVPADFPENYFTEKPRTVLLKPTDKLPQTPFWPASKVAFRVSTIPEVIEAIQYPITATSANFSGEPPIFSVSVLREKFGDQIEIFPGFDDLEKNPPSEIWDYTEEAPVRLR